MAFPLIEATQESTADSETPSFTMPSSIVSGELLLAVIGWRGSSLPVTVTTSGWTELTRNNIDSGNTGNVLVVYREADGTEGSSLVLSMDSANEATCAISRISGWDTATAPLGSSGGSGTSKISNPDPPSLSFGWTTDTLAICGVVQREDENFNVTPTGYTEVADFERSDKSRNRIDRKNITSSPENPSAYTLSSDRECSYYTLVIPSGGGGGGITNGIEVWSGSAWVTKPVKVWSGSAWATKPLKRWNGSAFV